MLGKHLFGMYPLSQKAASNSAGSAVLAGSVLVGAAARRGATIDDGDGEKHEEVVCSKEKCRY